MLWVLIWIEANPHRQSLYDFNEVAASILGRQKAEQSSSRTGEIFHRSFVITTERIDVDRNRLAGPHVLQLSFLEIRSDPDIVERNKREQTLPRLNPLAKFDRLAPNHPTDRRVYFGVAQIQLGGANVCFCLTHLADARLRFCFCIA